MRLNVKSADRLKAPERKVSDEDRKLWALVKEKLELGAELRRPFEREWIINLAFLSGRQYVFFNSSAHMLQDIARGRGRSRKVDNILLPKWRRQIADLIRDDPQMTVVPNTNEDEDVKAAKIGSLVLRSFWQSARMKKKRRELAGWIYATGNGFLDDRWNNRLGPTQLDPKSGKLVYLGDVDAGVWSPFEIFVPAVFLGDTELHRLPWLIKAKWRGLDYIRRTYANGDSVTPEQKRSSVYGTATVLGWNDSDAVKIDGALLIDFYMQPCSEYPKGLFVTAANGVILQKSDYPFTYYNLEHFKDIDIPGHFWGRATLSEAIPLQVRWNALVNSVDDFNRLASKGKLFAPRGAKLETVPDDSHGEVVFYKPVMGISPDWKQLKSMPPTIELGLQTIKVSLEDLFSYHEVSRGTNKSDIRSGEMVGLLLEQDAFGRLPSHAIFEESLEAWGSRILRRFQEGYTTERMIRVVGRENEFSVFAFKGADLRGNTDVSVRRQSSLPDSRVLRNNEVLLRFEKGLYGDPADPEVRRHVMSMLDDAIIDDLYGDTKLDEIYARYENATLASGTVTEIMVNPYDNHALHLQEHNHFRKTLDYQKIKLQDPQRFAELEIIFSQHTLAHQEFMQQIEKQMLERQAMLEAANRKEVTK